MDIITSTLAKFLFVCSIHVFSNYQFPPQRAGYHLVVIVMAPLFNSALVFIFLNLVVYAMTGCGWPGTIVDLCMLMTTWLPSASIYVNLIHMCSSSWDDLHLFLKLNLHTSRTHITLPSKFDQESKPFLPHYVLYVYTALVESNSDVNSD
jgi:hypothetical protein